MSRAISVFTTSFEEIYTVYMGALDPDLTPDERQACMNGFVSGMAAGIGILQNRIAKVGFELKNMPPEEKAKAFQHIAQACAESATDLQKLQMSVRGDAYGSA